MDEFPIAGVGASAGGLDAYRRLLGALPTTSGIAFVVVPHLDPTHESLMVPLLTRCTAMPVIEIQESMTVQANHVYVIPPNRYLTIRTGVLHLAEPADPRSTSAAFDWFLRSLAEDQQEGAICIILSGTGSHGTPGLRAVKANGGMALVQEPSTADFPSMPESAIASGLADHVLPVEKMHEALTQYAQSIYATGRHSAASFDESVNTISAILALLRARTDFDFRGYRKQMLRRRIDRRMALAGIGEMREYLTHLQTNSDEAERLIKDLMISVTRFFREPQGAFQVLEADVIPELIRRKSPNSPLRAWVVGCATGEEAYSLAMLFLEALSASGTNCRLRIFASDVDEASLTFARAGIYPESIAADVSPERLDCFFTRVDAHSYQVAKHVREVVTFAVQNLIGDAPYSELDLISCRNVLIYFEPELQRKVIPLLHFALNEQGYLLLGPSETAIHHADLFEPISKELRIYRRTGPIRRDIVDFPITLAPSRQLYRRQLSKSALPAQTRLRDFMQWLLLKEYAPASLLVDDGGQILYFYGATLPYLDLPSGEPTHNLLEMARDGLRNKLRTAIRKASKDQRPVTVQTRMKGNGRSYSLVRASVKPVQMPNYPETLLMVSFQVEREPAPSLPNDMIGDSLVGQLESELKESREELSSTIHDLQGSIEDLKSSNEEVMSMNEELQSSNEELETSKEELQSLNEELSTVNSQLYSKIDELEQVTNDITNLLDNTGIPTLFLDTHFCVRRFTPSATQILKLIAADVGRPLTDIASMVPDPDVLRDAAEVLRSENSIEKELPGPAGQWWIRRISPYRGTNSQVEGVVITFIDVTGVKIANERMNRLTAVLMDSNDAITVRDLAGNISGWSHGAEQLYGYTEEEALELNFLQLVPEELRTSEFAALEQLRESGRTDTRETQRVRRDGSVLDVWLTTTRLRNQNDGSVSFATIERDLTERKRMEQMRVARDSAQEATRIKSQFLAHMSHEIRTPLHGVMGTLSLLLDTELTAEQRAIAMMACDSAQFLLKVIEDILDFSRIEAGKLQLTSAPVDLRKIVHRVISVLRVIADEKNLELTHSIDPGLPILVRSDEFRLSQILTNLIANAIKFTERGSVRLDVSEVTAAPGTALLVSLPYLGQAHGYWIEFSVRDTGIGIQEELLAELFQSFSQVDGTISRKYGGTGLGLAISKQLVEMMGGEIGVESQIRVGSRFWFRVQLDAPSRAETIT